VRWQDESLFPGVRRLSKALGQCRIKRTDTVGEPRGAEICVAHMPSLKAKKLRKLPQQKVLLELCSRLANSIPWFCETHYGLNSRVYVSDRPGSGLPCLQLVAVPRTSYDEHRIEVTAVGHLNPSLVRRLHASPVLLLFEDSDVVHGLTLSVRAFCRDGHRLPVLGDDPCQGLNHRIPLLVSAYRGPCVDSLE
jgi:hypothetical protein